VNNSADIISAHGKDEKAIEQAVPFHGYSLPVNKLCSLIKSGNSRKKEMKMETIRLVRRMWDCFFLLFVFLPVLKCPSSF
jgi:hypothetical protein